MEEEINDIASNPATEEHLPVAGEIPETDSQIPADVLEDLGQGSSED